MRYNPTGTGILCFTHTGDSPVCQDREELRAEGEARVGTLLTVTMVIPCGFIPFCLSFSVFPNKSGIKKTDGHGYTWVWSYSFTPLSDLLMFSVFCLLSSVLDSNVDPEIALVHLGHGGVLCVCVSVCQLVCVLSLFGFVPMIVLLILSAKNSFYHCYSSSHPSFVF